MDDRLVRHPLGFWQVKDLPDLEGLRAYYEGRYYQTAQSNYRPVYPAEEIAWFHAKTARIAAAIGDVRGRSGGTVLDVGCGEGFAMDWFDRHGYAVRGVDFSRAGMEGAHPHLLDRLETGEVQELLDAHTAAGTTYDIIWLTNVLEHVIDPLALLTRLRRLLAAGGVLVVTVPNDGSAWQEFLYGAGRINTRFWIAIPDHLSYFDADSLRAVATATGWRCASMISDFPIDWFLGNPESDYVSHKAKGRGAHHARIAIDTVLAGKPVEAVNRLYAAMADVGMGRQLTAILTSETP
jgi:2-polyprenyl-3-methyl-5-hydroxy-6-metoxy-1,4-benzoquinol methylase